MPPLQWTHDNLGNRRGNECGNKRPAHSFLYIWFENVIKFMMLIICIRWMRLIEVCLPLG